MTDASAREKLISVRSICFRRGVLGRGGRIGSDDDFRQAFRTLNRLYQEAKRRRHAPTHFSRQRSGGA